MARNTLKFNTKGLESLLVELDKVGGDVPRTTELVLKKAAVKIMNDTIVAVDKANLPAGGKYSKGYTQASIIHFPQVEWEGNVAWVPVGFDFSKPGAGGFLISGTPRMSPDYQLNKMYKKKGYMNQVQREMGDEVMNAIIEKMGGG